MTCDQIEELLAAYAIGALSTGEAGDVRAHLATCRRHDAALAELRATVDSLALAAPEREPSAGLRARVLAAIDAEPAERVVVPMRPRRWFAAPGPSFALAAAAVLLIAIALGTWAAVVLTGDGEGGGGTLTASLSGSGGTGQFTYSEDDRTGVFDIDLADPPAGSQYQAWAIRESGPVSLGLLPSGSGTIAIEGDVGGAIAVAITLEPEGGSDQPTTQPVLSGTLT
jgi:anti-sigma-K factor RskA